MPATICSPRRARSQWWTGRAAGQLGPTWWASNGFVAILATALDPPHSAASPAVPVLIGSGSPSDYSAAAFAFPIVSSSAMA
jgi:hypothetical protein